MSSNALNIQMTGILCAATLAGCSLGGGGSPFSGASGVQLTFIGAAQTWDLNKDNIVACEEWKRYATELFQSADANRDGAVTREEYAGITRQDKLFETVGFGYFDGNGDGRLALAEFADKPNPAFTVLDKNKDCRLDDNEFVQTSTPPAPAKSDYGEKQGPNPGAGR